MAIFISNAVQIPEHEIVITAIRAQGAGGQNVNKVSSAIHLRFDIVHSSLPAFYKQRLLNLNDQRINSEGELIIKAQSHRTQQRNKDEAINRLKALIIRATKVQKKRLKSRPTLASKKRHLNNKKQQKQKKSLRKKVDY